MAAATCSRGGSAIAISEFVLAAMLSVEKQLPELWNRPPEQVFTPAQLGGLYGRHPSLDDLDNGDVKYTVDFRSVYATVLEKWLKLPAGPALTPYMSRIRCGSREMSSSSGTAQAGKRQPSTVTGTSPTSPINLATRGGLRPQ